jgi:hypothetical protein
MSGKNPIISSSTYALHSTHSGPLERDDDEARQAVEIVVCCALGPFECISS